MPAWLITLLIQLALKLGVPALVALLPKLPKWAQDIVAELIKQLQGANVQIVGAQELKKQAIMNAKLAIKSKGTVGVAPGVKKV